MRQSQRGRRAFRQLPMLVLDILKRQRTSLVAPLPLQRCVFSFFPEGLGRVTDSLSLKSYLPTSLTGGTTGNVPSGSVPPSTAPLENGSHTDDKPSPASEEHAHQVAVNESK